MLTRFLQIASLALVSLLLSSCGGSSTSGLNLFITDAPIDEATAVNISFARIQLTGPDVTPQTLTLSQAASVDLYQLQGGVTATIVSDLQIKPGNYTGLSITIAADPINAQSSITLPDGTHILYLPKGVSPTVTMPIDFSLASGGTVNMVIDFDLRRSIIQDPNDSTKYLLIPSARAVQIPLSGTLTGSIAASLITCLTPAVYIYQGDVTPTDENINAPAGSVQPFTTTLAGLNQTTGVYNFTAGFLPPGTYTVAFTCQASLDVVNQANTISFPSVTTAVVSAAATTFVALQ
ncbi:MAG TPA: DUF4382 domain-containing protein [Gammaproteobacteria bacterium]|nr:DUF4382 domain-containing protein [Gammaproteobacteria bacterium]